MPVPGGGVNLEHYFEALRFGLPQPPGLAHRLDRDTSGCLVLGRHRKALARVGRLFQAAWSRRSTGRWCAAARPSPRGRSSSHCASARRCAAGGWRPIRPARRRVTDYRVLGEADGISWLECRPRTGRTHQIRVHCAELGCPVLGDPIYGQAATAKAPPLQLHARSIALPLYPIARRSRHRHRRRRIWWRRCAGAAM